MNTQRLMALVKKEMKKLTREPATLFLLLLFPLVVTFVFGLAFGEIGGGETNFDIGVVNLDVTSDHSEWSENFVGNLSDLDGVTILSYDDNTTGHSLLLGGSIDALVVIPAGFGDSCNSYWMSPLNGDSWSNTSLGLYVDSGSMIASSAIPPMVQQVMLVTLFGEQAMTLDLPVGVGSPSLVEVSTLSQWDFMAPGIFAFSAIFITMTVAQTMTHDRDTGLLKRMATTPVKSSEVMISQTLSYMLVGAIQVALVFGASFAIGYRPATDAAGIAFAFLIVTAFTMSTVGFGLIAAATSKNAEIATGISFLFIMPQMFLGTFMPLGGVTEVLAKFIPSNYVTDALTTLFLRGAPVTTLSIWLDLLVIMIVGVSVLLAGIGLFGKYGNK